MLFFFEAPNIDLWCAAACHVGWSGFLPDFIFGSEAVDRLDRHWKKHAYILYVFKL